MFPCAPIPSFPPYCDNNNPCYRYPRNQAREELPNGWPRLIRVIEYEDNALKYVEKMGFSHNHVPRNCLLDNNLNLKLADFDQAKTIGQCLECSLLCAMGQETTRWTIEGHLWSLWCQN
jgi:hypothetical protein